MANKNMNMTMMKTYISILVLLVCGTFCYGQKKPEFPKRDVEKATVSNDKIIEYLNAENAILKKESERLDAEFKKYSQRNFSPKVTEEQLEIFLGTYSLKGLYDKLSNTKQKLAGAGDSKLTSVYSLLMDAYGSLTKAYNEETNKEYKKSLAQLGNNSVLSTHQSDVDKLKILVNDYRFMMFELKRVFKIIDTMKDFPSTSAIKEKLSNDGELEFLSEDCPYVRECLNGYINFAANGKDRSKKELLEELSQACPDAFKE